MNFSESQKATCKHHILERIHAGNFDKREPYPIFLFWCRHCGRTIAKQILEVTTVDKDGKSRVRLKEVRCILPYEFQPWRKIMDMDEKTNEATVLSRTYGQFESYIHRNIMEENNENGKH